MPRRTLVLGGLAGLNVLVGFAYQWYTLTYLGPGRATDALFAGMMIPQLVLAVGSGSLTHVLVPLLTQSDETSFRRDAWTFLQGIGVLFGACAVLLALGAAYWVPWTVPGFDQSGIALTVQLVRVQLIGMVFTACTAVLWSVYHARQRFVWAEISPVLASGIVFPFLVVALPRIGVTAAAWALVLKAALQMLLLLPGIGRYHWPEFGTNATWAAWTRVRPLLLGTTFYKTDQFVDRFLASMAPAGALSLFHFAQQLYAAGHQVLNTAIAAPMVPLLAQRAHQRDWIGFRSISAHRLRWMLAVTVLGLVGIAVVGLPVLSFLFGYGRFSSAEIDRLWWLMLAAGGIWIGGAAGQILSTSFYARGDTKTPTKVGVFGFTLGIGFKVLGFYLGGIIGVALGTTLYYLMNAILLQVLFSWRLRQTSSAVIPQTAVAYEHA